MTATSFPTSSDEKLKTAVEDLTAEECGQFVDAITPKKYTRIDTGARETGFIAQDVKLPRRLCLILRTSSARTGTVC